MSFSCMSGYTDDSIVRHGVMQAEIAYIQKPITAETLARKVRDVLDAPGAASERSPEGFASLLAELPWLTRFRRSPKK